MNAIIKGCDFGHTRFTLECNMKLIKYIRFCWKVWRNLGHFEMFKDYDGSKSKSYRLEMKGIDQKIRTAKKRGKQPKKEHVFLSMFYEAIGTSEQDGKKDELITLFCLLFFWWDTLEDPTPEEE